MSLQYSGNVGYDTFTQTLGTRREIVDNLVAILTGRLWTVVSGGGTGDVVLASAATPQGVQICCRIYDPGSGNCARVQIRNLAGSLVSQDFYLLPAVSKVWRVHASKYQCIGPFTPGASAGREFVAFGVPYIPSFLVGVITGYFGWANANGRSDSLADVMTSFRTQLASNTSAKWSGLCNSNMKNRDYYAGAGVTADFRLVIPHGAWTTVYDCYMWHDDSLYLGDPLIAWGLINDADLARVRGQLWDAAILSQAYPADTPFTFDGHTWNAITNNCSGGTYTARGTLLAASA